MQIASIKGKERYFSNAVIPHVASSFTSSERKVLHELTPVPLSALSVVNERRHTLS